MFIVKNNHKTQIQSLCKMQVFLVLQVFFKQGFKRLLKTWPACPCVKLLVKRKKIA